MKKLTFLTSALLVVLCVGSTDFMRSETEQSEATKSSETIEATGTSGLSGITGLNGLTGLSGITGTLGLTIIHEHYFTNDGEPHTINTQADKQIWIRSQDCSFEVSKSTTTYGLKSAHDVYQVIDTTFGDNGKRLTKIDHCRYGFNKVGAAILGFFGDHKIVVAGSNNKELVIVRYTANGLEDEDFGEKGIARVSIKDKDAALELLKKALMSDYNHAQKFLNHMQPTMKHRK